MVELAAEAAPTPTAATVGGAAGAGGGEQRAMDVNDLNTTTHTHHAQSACAAADPQRPAQHGMTHAYASNFTAASNLNISSGSLADSSSCTLATQHHQYHYIQYPPYYYHIGQMPQDNSCHCHCSCGAQRQRQLQLQQQQHQRAISASTSAIGYAHADAEFERAPDRSNDSRIVVQVHTHTSASTEREVDCLERGSGGGGSERPAKAQSEQSLLNHSYQTLQLHALEEKPLNVLRNSKLNISCDCDLECTCGAKVLRAAAAAAAAVTSGNDELDVAHTHETTTVLPAKSRQCQLDAMLGADEITVSESDNNSTMIKKKKAPRACVHAPHRKVNSWCHPHDRSMLPEKNCDCAYDSSHNEIYSDGDSKLGGHDSTDDQRPPLPPRPPPPPRLRNAAANGSAAHRHHGAGIKKYVVWCLICGGFSCLLGILFLGVYFLLHSYTITVGNFETVPTFVPATLLILTGLCIMSLARRRNRYSYLIKLSGACGLISALTCALVTVTTTVLHMSRLQALRECEYAQKTRTCTCYSDMIESQVDRVDKEGVRLVFDSLSDCGVVHGSLYSCLRAIFGLSVAGVLIAVFSCMLVYQLLSHERKKMYWEQLELRCRSLYTSQQGPPPNMAAMASARGAICRCCEQCHLHRQVPLQNTAYPWDESAEPRFWAGQPPGNFYSPNPGGDDIHGLAAASGTCRGGHTAPNTRSRMTGWSWPRMPWQRNSPDPSTRQFRQTPSSPDSQYGFTNNAPANADGIITDTEGANVAGHGAATPFNVVTTGLPYGVWGPPPPYSDPNSPARRGYYQYIQPNVCTNSMPNNNGSGALVEHHVNANSEQRMPCLNHRSVFLDPAQHQANSSTACCPQTASMRRNSAKRQTTGGGGGGNLAAMKSKVNGDYENTPSDSDGGLRDRFSNTLPTRKVKKRIEANAKATIGMAANPQPAPRMPVQQIFPNATNSSCASESETVVNEHDCQEPMNSGLSDEANETVSATTRLPPRATPRHTRGIENNAFQENGDAVVTGVVSQSDAHGACEAAESEVYFADVSSCCNMSLKNDNYYEDANQGTHHATHMTTQAAAQQPHQSHHHHQHQGSSCSQTSSNNEDYLAQRFGQRENSIRSRLPFPQTRNDDYEENLNVPFQKSSSVGGAVTPVNHMQKEMSRQSMCSVESEAKTEFTDLSPATPCSNKFAQTSFDGKHASELSDAPVVQRVGAMPNFVATFPYSSESQSLEAHRRSTKDIHELLLTTEAHYEVINDNPPPACAQFVSVANSGRGSGGNNKTPAQRPTNLLSGKSRNVNEHPHKSKHTNKTRERHETERDWNTGSNAGVGGSSAERKCL